MSWLLRRASVADLDAIMRIEESVFENDAWSARGMRAELESAHTYYLVAEPVARPESGTGTESEVEAAARPGDLAGYAGLLCPRGAHEADIQTIAVAPAARRRGLGRTLVIQLVREAAERGAREVFLEVRADNPGAEALYTEIGFEPIGVRAKYYQPDGVDAIVMRLAVTSARTALAEPGPDDQNRGAAS